MRQVRPEAHTLIAKLSRKRDRYRGSRLRRFICHPIVTVVSSIAGRITNRFTRPINKTVRLFFGELMDISVPPYLELWISKAYASHDPEVRLTEWLFRNIKEGDTFLDCGAHYGYYTVLAAQRVGENGKVVAVEPSPLVLPYLRKNVARSKNAELVEAGVSDSEGTATFYESDIQYSVISTLNKNNLNQIDHLGGIAREVQVETTTLEKIAADHGDPTIIKLDVEGAEAQTLRGGAAMIARMKPAIALEVFLRPTDNDRAAVAILKSYGYRMYAITPGGGITEIEYRKLDHHLSTTRHRYGRMHDDAIIDNLIFLKS